MGKSPFHRHRHKKTSDSRGSSGSNGEVEFFDQGLRGSEWRAVQIRALMEVCGIVATPGAERRGFSQRSLLAILEPRLRETRGRVSAAFFGNLLICESRKR
jgi:hypothetical protein